MKQMFTLRKIKWALYGALFLVAAILFLKWQAANPPPQVASQAVGSQVEAGHTRNGVSLPVLTSNQPAFLSPPPSHSQLIHVKTPLMEVAIDPLGGDIVQALLTEYKEKKGSALPFTLLNQDENGLYYVVESGLVSEEMAFPEKMNFVSSKTTYSLANSEQILNVDLTWTNHQGLSLVKTYTFFPNQYLINVTYTVQNSGKSPWKGRFYGELTRNAATSDSGFLNSYTNYTGAAVSSPNDHYQKVKFSSMSETNLNQTVDSGWVAMLQHYFITAWVPTNKLPITQFSAVDQGLYSIGLATTSFVAQPGSSASSGASLYLGPAIGSQLSAVAPYLNKTIDYGWLWFISELIFTVMKWIFTYVGNWGLAIILVTVLIKLVFYPLSAKSYTSMAKMRELQPKVKALREKFGTDRQKIGVATMELYRKEKVNPLGGCLPIAIQIPVFIALYWVLMESVELRQAPFFAWIQDLSARDPYFILPVLMGLSMFAQQKLNPPPPDPMQAKIMMFLPLIFTVMFLGFPAGLVLYWLVNNCLSIAQQWWVMSRYHKKMAAKRHHHQE